MNNRDAHAEAAHLVIERFGIALDGMFGGRVMGVEGGRDDPQPGAHVQDAAAALLAHGGQDRIADPHHTEHIRFEQRPHLINRAFFRRRRAKTEAGIVDQQIDAPLQPQQFVDGGLDRGVVSHIQRQHRECALARLGAAPAGAVHLVAGSGEFEGGGFADVRGSARDEGDAFVGLHGKTPEYSAKRRPAPPRGT